MSDALNQDDEDARKARRDDAAAHSEAYGEGSIMRLGDAYQVKIDVIPTGALAVDLEEEILKAAVVTHGGAVVHEGVRG